MIPMGDLFFIEDSNVYIIKVGKIEIIDHGNHFKYPSLAAIFCIDFCFPFVNFHFSFWRLYLQRFY